MAIKIHLAKLLGERKMKVAHLARQTGISQYALHNIYHEKTSAISFEILDKLCAFLDVSVGELLEYIPKDPDR
jgi:putative transcriptional regulator